MRGKKPTNAVEMLLKCERKHPAKLNSFPHRYFAFNLQTTTVEYVTYQIMISSRSYFEKYENFIFALHLFSLSLSLAHLKPNKYNHIKRCQLLLVYFCQAFDMQMLDCRNFFSSSFKNSNK